MRAGDLDRLITIESFTSSQNAYGEPVESWATLAQVWAKVRPLSGNETFTTEQMAGLAMTEFTIRYRADVNTTHRITYNGATYNIRLVSELGRREGLVILAEAVNP